MEDFCWNYDILLPVLNMFSFDTEEYCVEVNYKVYCAMALKKGLQKISTKTAIFIATKHEKQIWQLFKFV